MKRTGVFATAEEATEIKELAEKARTTPAIMIHHGGGPARFAWDRCMKRLHEVAMSHGLPEIRGYYGFDGDNNEFLEGGLP